MTRSRWAVLAAGTVAQTSQAAAYAGLAVLAPVLRDQYGLSLSQVGVLLGVASVGAMITLLAWGIAADHVGERATAVAGLGGAAAGYAASAYAPEFASLVLLLSVAGAFGASSNTATGRAVTSWFPRSERGFALGIRQTSVPIGGFAAALAVPAIAAEWGARGALLTIAGLSLVAAVVAAAFLVEGPVRSDLEDEADALRRPLRDTRIWLLSTGSGLLVSTQVAVTGFVVLFLESERGFGHGQAGAVLAGMNVLAAAGRLGGGRLSDRTGRRVGLIRWIAVATAAVTAVVAALVGATGPLLVPALIVAGGLSMSWNGLAVTAAVETAGPRRSGAALGLQQTALGVAVVVAPLLFAPLVAATSWRAGFAVAAALPLLALVALRPLER
jgi:MFS family permease